MKTITPLLSVATFLIFFSFSLGLHAEPVERIPPPIYGEALEPELTPLESLLDEVAYFTPEDSSHGTLLQENLVYIDSSGRVYEVIHQAYKALSNGNLDDIGTDIYYFRPEAENIYLIKAETIMPDGSRRDVPDEGILIQTPARDRSSLIFSGRKQLRLIYPQVSEGSVTHCIILIEREKQRIPGQYTDRYSWERSWQTHLKRVVLTLPENDRKRLNMVSFGEGVPEAEETVLDDGRIRLEWKREKLPVRTSEKLDGPLLQTGPALFLSTIADWNEFAEWYGERVRESSVLTDEIKAIAKEWAGDAVTEDEIIHNLAFRVANDIRYVSLEFRVGGLVPQPISGILENRFGDCKDKSNFLRMLLLEHGIKSYNVLINTEHAGRVEKRCADYAYFNHMILLIEKANGETVLCDPTIKYGSAGLLYPSIGDRPALVIDHEKLEPRWIHTPPIGAGSINYEFDLKLSENGELSGWFSLRADGYYSSSFSRQFQETDRDRLKYEVERYLGYFYGASTVIDYELERARSDNPIFTLKTYFVRSATGQADRSVGWPSIQWILPQLGEKKEVQREVFLWPHAINLTLKMELPDGSSVERRPDDWSVETGGFHAEGSWRPAENGLQAGVQFAVEQARYDPPEFAKLFTAVDASIHWTEQLAFIGRGASSDVEKVASTNTVELGDEFALMSTGKGQVALVDHLYPQDSKPKKRRLALEKTKLWFPKDLATQFECDIRLGWLLYTDKQFEECLEVVNECYRNYSHAVNTFSRGWARYLEAMALEEVDRRDESLNIFRELEADPEMNEFRRGYAAYQYARMMVEQDPDAAKTYYLKAYQYETQNEKWMLEHSFVFLMEHASGEELAKYLRDLMLSKPEKAKTLALWLAELAEEYLENLNGLKHASKTWSIITQAELAQEIPDQSISSRLEGLHLNFKNYVRCRRAFREFLDEGAYSVWKGLPDRERSIDEYTEDINKATEEDDIAQSCYLTLCRIGYLQPEAEFPVWIWEAARRVDYLIKNGQEGLEPLRSFIFDARKYLPAEADGTIDLDFIHAESLDREDHDAEALAVYQALHDQQLETRWLNSLYTRWSTLLLSSGDMDKAIEVFAEARSQLKENEDLLPLSNLGIYALLQKGEIDAALAWMAETDALCRELEIDNEHSLRVHQWIELEERGRLKEFWAFHKTWWPAWEDSLKRMRLPTETPPKTVNFTDLESAGATLKAAINEKDKDTIADILGQLMISAQWHPVMCTQVQSMVADLMPDYPTAKGSLYRCAVLMNCEAFLLDEDQIYSVRNNTLELMLEQKQYEELQKAAEVFFNDTENERHKNMYCRYGGLAMVNLERPQSVWLERMERGLQQPREQKSPYAVNIMSRLYRLEGRTHDERDLLNHYLTHNKADNEEMNELLENRLKKLDELMNGNQQMSEALSAWMEAYRPTWVDVFPDPELSAKSVSEVNRKVEELLNTEQRLKLVQAVYLMHAMADERLSSSVREDAFYSFLAKTLDPIWKYQRNLPMLDAVVQDKRFSDNLRSRCTTFAGNISYVFAVPNYVEEHYLPNMELLGLKDNIDGIKLKIAFNNRDLLSVAVVSEWMRKVQDELQPFRRSTVYLLNLAFSNLCELGDIEAAEKQIESAKRFSFEIDANSSTFSHQLKWRQQLDQVVELMPIHQVMAAFFTAVLEPSEMKPSVSDVQQYRGESLAEQRRIIRGLLQFGLYDHTSLYFWRLLNDLEYMHGNICVDSGNLERLLGKLLGACRTDSQYQQAVKLAIGMFDTDDKACEKILFALTKEISLQPGMEKTKQELLTFQYKRRIRCGDYKAALADLALEKSLSKQDRHNMTMEALLVSKDLDALNTYLSLADADLLLDDGFIADTLLAYKLCGNTGAYGLVKESAEAVFLEFKARAMQTGEHRAVYFSAMLADRLENPDALDDAWMDAVAMVAREDTIQYMRMYVYHMRGDWPATEAAAQKLSEMKPVHYNTYFYLGKALIKQGRFAEGIKALKPFLQFCRDSIDYEEARELNDLAQSKI